VADLSAQVVLATSSRPHGGNWSATAESEDKDATTNQTAAGGRDIAVVWLRVVTSASSTSATDSCTRNVLGLLRKSESSLISSDSAAFADHCARL